MKKLSSFPIAIKGFVDKQKVEDSKKSITDDEILFIFDNSDKVYFVH